VSVNYHQRDACIGLLRKRRGRGHPRVADPEAFSSAIPAVFFSRFAITKKPDSRFFVTYFAGSPLRRGESAVTAAPRPLA